MPLLKAIDTSGNYYGDAAVFMAFGTGPAKGGKILYVWDTLLSSPQGQAIMADTVSWILDAVLRPPPPRFDLMLKVDASHAAFHFSAAANIDYVLQSRASMGSGAWSLVQNLLSAPTNRSLWVTGYLDEAASRFYRVGAGP